jgi:hypothetical protein
MGTGQNGYFLRIIVSVMCIGIFSALMSPAFALEGPLRTELAEPSDLKGTFTLFLYGGRYADDIETIAIFDPEGERNTFNIFAPDFDYKIIKGLNAQEALARAEKFVSFHNTFWHQQLRRILDHQGHTVGYELRPLYLPFVYGSSDVLDVYYWLKKDNTIKVTIRLIPSVERRRFPGGPFDSSTGD